MTDRELLVGNAIAQAGARIYAALDRVPELESDQEVQQIMNLINKVAYRLINGKERDVQTDKLDG